MILRSCLLRWPASSMSAGGGVVPLWVWSSGEGLVSDSSTSWPRGGLSSCRSVSFGNSKPPCDSSGSFWFVGLNSSHARCSKNEPTVRGDSMGDNDRRGGEQEGRCNGEVEACTPPFLVSAEGEEPELQPAQAFGEALPPLELRMRRMMSSVNLCDWLRQMWETRADMLPAVRLDLSIELQHLSLQGLTGLAESSTSTLTGSKLRPENDIIPQRSGDVSTWWPWCPAEDNLTIITVSLMTGRSSPAASLWFLQELLELHNGLILLSHLQLQLCCSVIGCFQLLSVMNVAVLQPLVLCPCAVLQHGHLLTHTNAHIEKHQHSHQVVCALCVFAPHSGVWWYILQWSVHCNAVYATAACVPCSGVCVLFPLLLSIFCLSPLIESAAGSRGRFAAASAHCCIAVGTKSSQRPTPHQRTFMFTSICTCVRACVCMRVSPTLRDNCVSWCSAL